MTVGKTRFREKNRDFALKLLKNRDFGDKNRLGNRECLRLKNEFSDVKLRIRVKNRVFPREIVCFCNVKRFCNHTLHHPKKV